MDLSDWAILYIQYLAVYSSVHRYYNTGMVFLYYYLGWVRFSDSLVRGAEKIQSEVVQVSTRSAEEIGEMD